MIRQHRVALLLLLFFVSGFAGLGHELVWARMLGLGLGHEMPAVLAVLASFFCGVALGARALDGPASRSTRPHRLFALLEGVIGGWTLALILLIPWANRAVLPVFGFSESPVVQWLGALGYTFALLLPATFAMGGTLPAMETLVSTLRHDGRSVGVLYAVNTLGAMAGTVATVFLLLPPLGFAATLALLAGLNFLAALGVLLVTSHAPALDARIYPRVLPSHETRYLWTVLFWTGLLGIGFEVMAVRLLSQVLQNTVYSFAMILAVYLLGTALGAGLYQRLIRSRGFHPTLQFLLIVLSSSCLVGVLLLRESGSIYNSVIEALGGGFVTAVFAELAVASAVFLPPTLIMGMLFCHLAQRARTQRGGLGRAICVNTLGAACSPVVFGVCLLPAMGSKWALLTLSVGYLVPALARQRSWPRMVVPVALAVLVASLDFQSPFVALSEGDRVVEHAEGVAATVTVVQRESGHTVLKINNHFQMGGTASFFADRRQGHIPLLLHPDPQSALFLGLGTGATFAAAAEHPRLNAVAVELLPEVSRVLPHFRACAEAVLGHPRLHVVTADARRYINRTLSRYDVIVADLFHPARDGAGSLYTREHFAAVRRLLNDHGVFCQWLPLYQMDLTTLQLVSRTFLDVFPDAAAYLTHYNLDTPIIGLVGSQQPQRFSADWFERRTTDPGLAHHLRRIRLDDFFTLFGCYIAGSGDLREFCGEGPLNTDNHPLVIYEAPRFLYTDQGNPAERLLELLGRVRPRASDLLANNPQTPGTADRLERYWRARDQFLRVGIEIGPSNGARHLLAQIRDPLLQILRLSSDFEAAYLPLVGLAVQQHRSDPHGALQLLCDLEQLCPARVEARRARQHLRRCDAAAEPDSGEPEPANQP